VEGGQATILWVWKSSWGPGGTFILHLVLTTPIHRRQVCSFWNAGECGKCSPETDSPGPPLDFGLAIDNDGNHVSSTGLRLPGPLVIVRYILNPGAKSIRLRDWIPVSCSFTNRAQDLVFVHCRRSGARGEGAVFMTWRTIYHPLAHFAARVLMSKLFSGMGRHS